MLAVRELSQTLQWFYGWEEFLWLPIPGAAASADLVFAGVFVWQEDLVLSSLIELDVDAARLQRRK